MTGEAVFLRDCGMIDVHIETHKGETNLLWNNLRMTMHPLWDKPV